MGLIRDLPSSEKPREKALKYGISVLSNRELLALLIRTGIKDRSSLDIADDILQLCDGISNLSVMDNARLMSIKGINKAKAMELKAVFELARRMSLEEISKPDSLNSVSKMTEWLKREIGDKTQEMFLVVFLNNSLQFLNYKILFSGTINCSNVYPRDIIKEALTVNASRIILCHNHPSGNISPSSADIQTTDNVIQACDMVNINVVDHIIVSKNHYYSFKENGLL